MPRKHKVKQGEGIKKIAQEYGFPFWKTIWDDSDNAALRDLRKNPGILQPGDIVIIPDLITKQETAATEMRHKFVYKVPGMTETLRLKLLDRDNAPLAGKPFLLAVDGEEIEGSTDGDGMLEQEIPANAKEGRIEIEGNVWFLELAHLNPVDEAASDGNVLGVQSRLSNLGIPCPESGEFDEATSMAVRAFQKLAGFDETGELNDETKAALKERHGS